jgi:DNA-binding GntR family transcriptional regulator
MTEFTGQSAYTQIADELRRRIMSGELAPGTKLPSASQLMRDFGVSSTVVKNAMLLLRASGHVFGHQGKAVFARLPEPEPWITGLISAGSKLAELLAGSDVAERDNALSAWAKALGAVPYPISG